MYKKNSFILSSVFILVSSFFLLVTPHTGYAQPISDCCFAQGNGSAGCDNQACEELICDQDEFCCDVEWDFNCAGDAVDQCEVCGLRPFNFAISLEPLEAVNPVSTDHTVTATVLESGIPLEGIFVTFEVISGPNFGINTFDGDGECSPEDCATDANGQISWTYSSSLIGIDTINASASSTASNDVRKEWLLVRNIPTLSEWGMISAAAILGLIALIAIRRRKAVS